MFPFTGSDSSCLRPLPSLAQMHHLYTAGMLFVRCHVWLRMLPCPSLTKAQCKAVVSLSSQQCPKALSGIAITLAASSLCLQGLPGPAPSSFLSWPDSETHHAVAASYLKTPSDKPTHTHTVLFLLIGLWGLLLIYPSMLSCCGWLQENRSLAGTHVLWRKVACVVLLCVMETAVG